MHLIAIMNRDAHGDRVERAPRKPRLVLLVPAVIAVALLVAPPAATTQSRPPLFADDFETDLSRWQISNPEAIAITDSGDAEHGGVLRLTPADAQLVALMRGSERWPAYRIEGEVLFPDDRQNYLGLVYNHVATDRRADLGSIYIKGNNSYIRVNPRRDWNPARMLYEEYRTPLAGADAIVIGAWQRFAAEVVDGICHFYVGDMMVPKVTFDLYEGRSGQAGFKPRVAGGPVWLDNVRVTAIDGLSYEGPRRPQGIDYRPQELVTDWRALGPLTRIYTSVERAPRPDAVTVVDDGLEHRFAPFETDARGAVITGRVVEFLGSRTVAYFATRIEVPDGSAAELQVSTIDDLAFWRNGRFVGYLTRDTFAWHDLGRNPDHPATARMPLEPGVNDVLIRVRGGIYATGGFFARVARTAAPR